MKKTTCGITAALLYLASLLLGSTLAAMPSQIVNYNYNDDGSIGESASVIKDSMYNYDMTANNGTVTITQSGTPLLGLAGYYDGTTTTTLNYNSGLDIGSGAFTIALWMNPTSSNSNVSIGGNRYNTGSGWSLRLLRTNYSDASMRNQVVFDYTRNYSISSDSLSANTDPGVSIGWNFIAVTGEDIGGGQLEISIFTGDTEGNLRLSESMFVTPTESINGDASRETVGVGYNVVRNEQPYNGSLDEFSLWKEFLDYELGGADGMDVVGGELYSYYTSMIPEPAAAGALLGLLALAVVWRRRR